MMQERRMQEERNRDFSEGRRREEAYMAAQEERRRHEQQDFNNAPRGAPPPPQHQMHPSQFPSSEGFAQGHGRGMSMSGLRAQSMRDVQDTMYQQETMRREAAFREQEQAEHARRAYGESLYPSRRTPMGMGGFGGPPPPGAPPGQGRR